MADYTYATSTRDVYDEFVDGQKKRAQDMADHYKAKETEANISYNRTMNGIQAQKIKALEETAAADTQKVQAAYDGQFDANAAAEFARRRALKEQMANYGLEQSGFNATNQTALTVARNNADAATRAARQQAVDAIHEELRKRKADSENELAEKLANNARESADRVLQNEQTLQNNVHKNAMDLVGAESDRAGLDIDRERVDVDREALDIDREKAALDREAQVIEREDMANEKTYLLKSYVDDHNKYVYDNMLSAYNSGNTALAEEYAKQLWQLNADGTVSRLPFDTAASSTYVKTKTEREAAANRQESNKEAAKETHDGLGFPQRYSEYIEDARNGIAGLLLTEDEQAKESMTQRAMSLLYLIEEQSKNGKGDAYMDEKTFQNLLRYVGVTQADYAMYKATAAYM